MPERCEQREEGENVLIGDVGEGRCSFAGCVCVCGLCEHKGIFMLRGLMHTRACESGL